MTNIFAQLFNKLRVNQVFVTQWSNQFIKTFLLPMKLIKIMEKLLIDLSQMLFFWIINSEKEN